MGLFDGVDIFGQESTIVVEDLPRQIQRTGFFGISGVLQIDGGARGKVCHAAGRHQADSMQDLGAIHDFIWSYKDGYIYLLMDNKGAVWYATLDGFHPRGRAELNSATGGYQQYFTLEFFIFG